MSKNQLIEWLKDYLEDYEITTEHDPSMANVIEWFENCTPTEKWGDLG